MLEVKEDGPIAESAVAGTNRVSSYPLIRAVAFACCIVVGAPSYGQSDTPFRASVLDQSDSVQRISVLLHGSVTVETTVEFNSAAVISENIADVQVMSPTRLLITGRSYGTTHVVLTGANDQQYLLEVTVRLDLRRLNAVAYVRFMSVHRKYTTVEEFIEEVRDVRTEVAHDDPGQQPLFRV